MNPTVLLISTNQEDMAFVGAVAEVSGLSVRTEADPQLAAEIIANEEVQIIFLDCSTIEKFKAFESAVREKVGLFSDKINPNHIHFLSKLDLQEVSPFFQSPIFGHYVSQNYNDPVDAGKRYGFVVKGTLQERIFGMKNLIVSGTKIQTLSFDHTTKKQEGVEAVKNFLLAAGFKSRMATVIANAVDELLMNAMFDAPVDEVGRPLYISTKRDAPIELQGRQKVELHVGFDKEYVAISATDHFGSLDKGKLFAHISKRYVEEEYKVKSSVAGAGIGLATVFRSGGSFCFASEAGVMTEVTVFFKKTDNFRAFKNQFRFISTQFHF